MILSKAFEKFVEGSPVCVMIRGTLEYAFPEQFVNELFENTAQQQYTRELLFSDVVDVMGGVVCQVFPSVYAAYQKRTPAFPVSRRTLYGKINHVEPRITRELVRQTAQSAGTAGTKTSERLWPEACYRAFKRASWTEIIWQPRNIVSRNSGKSRLGRCRGRPWRCSILTGV